ncbi:SUF system Fe-S cluster assembly regulator [Pontiellaceae bacterium B12219]|nr:SUF system Fe-S cluster assembly regulator [Pontiellaceae bacterium B12219]
MLKLTKIEGYSFQILTCIASRDSSLLHTAKELAEQTKLPLPTVSKILKMLTQSNILISFQGSRGGYSLTKPAEKISVADIVAAFEGPLALTDCCSEGGCERNCRIAPNWRKLNIALERWLRSMTLADMAEENALPSLDLKQS